MSISIAAAGITNPDIARAAELDFLATGDPSFVTAAAAAQQQASTVLTSTPTVIASNPLPAIGVIANAATVTETSSGTTPVTFTAYITSTQTGNGAWRFPPYIDEMSTVWAILFLTKSTTKTLKRIEVRKLGAGTLLGGRYLPDDLSTMTVAGGRVISRPISPWI